MKYKIAFLSLILLLATYTYPVSAASIESLEAYGVDSIAGYNVPLRTSRTLADTNIIFTVTKPDSITIDIPARTDSSGIASIELFDYHTKTAGKYAVSARKAGEPKNGLASFFMVYPDSVSLEKSSILASRSIVKTDTHDSTDIVVNVLDQYGNPFSGHLINLVSSRESDQIYFSGKTNITDTAGTSHFSVSSSEPGVSILSAIDLTANVVLQQRIKIGFTDNFENFGMGGFIPVASAAEAGPLYKFSISELPAKINANQNVSFRVTAQDVNGVTVENYTGVIHFFVNGTNGSDVTLPEDYTFKAEDLGSHSFGLGLSFKADGTYSIGVSDTSNPLIKDVLEVKVGTPSGGSTGGTGTGILTKPTISSPVAGSYSDSIQTITGTATPGANLKIYDNEMEIGSIQADSSGKFSYQTSTLTDGTHKIYVATADGASSSDTLDMIIDTTAPTVDEVQLNPATGIKPADIVDITVYSETNLAETAVIFNGDIIPLTNVVSDSSAYEGKLNAPATEGSFPIDVVLKDQLGNYQTYYAKAIMNVSAQGGSVIYNTQQTQTTLETESTQETQTTVPIVTTTPPSDVYGVIGYTDDKKVTLSWEPAVDDKGISHYRIYYGVDPLKMDTIVNTKNAAPTWYIPNLENGKEYYFAVTAVDTDDTESVSKSDIVNAVPFGSEVSNVVPNPADGLINDDNDPLHPASVESLNHLDKSAGAGPEMGILLLPSLAGAYTVIRRKKHK